MIEIKCELLEEITTDLVAQTFEPTQIALHLAVRLGPSELLEEALSDLQCSMKCNLTSGSTLSKSDFETLDILVDTKVSLEGMKAVETIMIKATAMYLIVDNPHEDERQKLISLIERYAFHFRIVKPHFLVKVLNENCVWREGLNLVTFEENSELYKYLIANIEIGGQGFFTNYTLDFLERFPSEASCDYMRFVETEKLLSDLYYTDRTSNVDKLTALIDKAAELINHFKRV